VKLSQCPSIVAWTLLGEWKSTQTASFPLRPPRCHYLVCSRSYVPQSQCGRGDEPKFGTFAGNRSRLQMLVTYQNRFVWAPYALQFSGQPWSQSTFSVNRLTLPLIWILFLVYSVNLCGRNFSAARFLREACLAPTWKTSGFSLFSSSVARLVCQEVKRTSGNIWEDQSSNCLVNNSFIQQAQWLEESAALSDSALSRQ
jgi:hypothetical protein